jgi:ribosomal protein S18 acetylase RimI-like enzyme
MGKRIYKKLGISDLPLVIDMGKNFRSSFIVEENTRQFLLNPQNWLFTCIEKDDGEYKKPDKIIGFAYGYELNRLNADGNMLYIHEVSVLPEYHRQGIGTELLSNITTLCKLMGICKFFLGTQKSNNAAMALYKKSGGKPTVDTEHGDCNVEFYFNTKNE